jgi:hypothetical protein
VGADAISEWNEIDFYPFREIAVRRVLKSRSATSLVRKAIPDRCALPIAIFFLSQFSFHNSFPVEGYDKTMKGFSNQLRTSLGTPYLAELSGFLKWKIY